MKVASYEEIQAALKQDGVDMQAVGLTLEMVQAGAGDTLLLLRRELKVRPEKVAETFGTFSSQLKAYLQTLARKKANMVAFAAQASDLVSALQSMEIVGDFASKIPIIGQALAGLVQIVDRFIQASAEMEAAGLGRPYGGVVWGDSTPEVWGWRAGGYWMADMPVLSFQAPIYGSKLNAASRPPGSLAVLIGAVVRLATTYPYGFTPPIVVDPLLASGGIYEVYKPGDGAGREYIKQADGKPMLSATLVKISEVFPPGEPPAPAPTPSWAGGVARALYYSVGAYHDGYLNRPRPPTPADFSSAENVATLNQYYAQGVGDRGGADRFAGQAGFGDSQQQIPATTPIKNGDLVRVDPDPHVWHIVDGTRRWVVSPVAFNTRRYSWDAIRVVTAAELAAIPQGPDEGPDYSNVPYGQAAPAPASAPPIIPATDPEPTPGPTPEPTPELTPEPMLRPPAAAAPAPVAAAGGGGIVLLALGGVVVVGVGVAIAAAAAGRRTKRRTKNV